MATKQASTASLFAQAVPAPDLQDHAPNNPNPSSKEVIETVREGLRPLVPVAPLLVSYRPNEQTGTARREFIEAVVIALLSFSIGLALGAALCMRNREEGDRP